jgi:hypothetical protein
MAVRTLSAADRVVHATRTPEPTQLPTPSKDLRYRIVVLSSNIADVVDSAGGWLFDRALAGCEVTALVGGRHDDRALRILGVQSADLDSALVTQLRDLEPDALAVSADLYRCDPRVRQAVLEMMDAGLTNVIVWGDTWASELEGLVSSVHHPLSLAARAFKEHALRATAAPSGSVDSHEMFRGVDLRTCQAACSHLVVAS